MPGLDFENSIQKKMQDLSLNPSPEVWSRVDKTLKDRKRKKRAAWIFFFALLLGSGLMLQPGMQDLKKMHRSGENKREREQAPFIKQAPNATSTSETATTAVIPEQVKTGTEAAMQAPDRIGKGPLVAGMDSTAVSVSRSKAGLNSPLPSNNYTSGNTIPSMKVPGAVKQSASRFTRKQGVAIKGSGKQEVSGKAAGANAYDQSIADPETTKTGDREGAQNEDRELFSAMPGNLNRLTGEPDVKAPFLPKAKLVLSTASQQEKKKKDASNKKWAISLYAAAGASQVFQHLVSEPAYSLMASVPSSTNLYSRPPSKEKAGPAFQAGVIFDRSLGSKLAAGIGLGYAYYSNNIVVGNINNSSTTIYTSRQQVVMVNTSYFASGNVGRKYVNQYHYLQVPVELNWTPDRNKRWSIRSGFMVGYLLSDNALQYDDQAGIYYHDKTAAEKWRTDLHSTIHYRFWQKNGIGISAGPVIQYQLNALNRFGVDRHFGFLGISTKFMLRGNH